jgi:hypothetical protein
MGGAPHHAASYTCGTSIRTALPIEPRAQRSPHFSAVLRLTRSSGAQSGFRATFWMAAVMSHLVSAGACRYSTYLTSRAFNR